MQVATGTLRQLSASAARRSAAKVCRAAVATQLLRKRTITTQAAPAAKRWLRVSNGQARRYFRATPAAYDYPSHKVIAMPALSPTMTQGNVANWMKKEGDEVATGDVLAEIETDKATMEFEASDDGFLAKILTPPGSKDVPVGQALCVIVDEKDDVSAFADFKADGAAPAKPTPKPAEAAPPAPAPTPAAAPPPSAPVAAAPAPAAPKPAAAPAPTVAVGGGRGSPLAKRLARELGFDISKIPGSGPDGRVVEKDVYAFAKTAIAAGPSTDASAAAPAMSDAQAAEAHTALAARLLQAKQTVPHYYLTTEVNLDPIYKLDEELSEGKDKVGASAFILKATALASLAVPACNSSWLGTSIRQYNSVDISLAVPTAAGTLAPVIKSVEAKGLKALASSAKALTEQAKSGAVSAAEQGGTITVSTQGLEVGALLGAAAIVMPPQACSLSVGSPIKRLVPGKDGKPAVATISQVTLSCDHRVVDGAVGAEWLKVFKALCEKPTRMLL
eukprot:comp21618_c0_seq1/m.30310 comp21618_c0_seq1/g.30310  ORF comp21618_c0_seq1/g.30310 comp21618_c0_seq1/m.30310 type:complete len:503 (-) comp21618_c0_seq1:337-1845(-)